MQHLRPGQDTVGERDSGMAGTNPDVSILPPGHPHERRFA